MTWLLECAMAWRCQAMHSKGAVPSRNAMAWHGIAQQRIYMKKKLNWWQEPPLNRRKRNSIKHSFPDADFDALKACCRALESCSCPRMVKATLDFLNSKYAKDHTS